MSMIGDVPSHARLHGVTVCECVCSYPLVCGVWSVGAYRRSAYAAVQCSAVQQPVYGTAAQGDATPANTGHNTRQHNNTTTQKEKKEIDNILLSLLLVCVSVAHLPCCCCSGLLCCV